MNKLLISNGKNIINNYDIVGIKDFCHEIKNLSCDDYEINYQYIYQQLFTHTCLKKRKEIIIYLIRLYFEVFDDVAKIALRQSFFYAKYIIKKDNNLVNWYNNNIIPIIKSY